MKTKAPHPTLTGEIKNVAESDRLNLLNRRKTIKFKLMIISILIIIFIVVVSVRFTIESENFLKSDIRANISTPFISHGHIIHNIPKTT